MSEFKVGDWVYAYPWNQRNQANRLGPGRVVSIDDLVYAILDRTLHDSDDRRWSFSYLEITSSPQADSETMELFL